MTLKKKRFDFVCFFSFRHAHLERSGREKEPRERSPVRSVVLPPNLHLLSLSIPGWNYSSDHDVHLSHINSGKYSGLYREVLKSSDSSPAD